MALEEVVYSSDSEEPKTDSGIVIPVVNKNNDIVGRITMMNSTGMPILQIDDIAAAVKNGEIHTLSTSSCSAYVGCVINCVCMGNTNPNACIVSILSCIGNCCGCSAYLGCLACAACFAYYITCGITCMF